MIMKANLVLHHQSLNSLKGQVSIYVQDALCVLVVKTGANQKKSE